MQFPIKTSQIKILSELSTAIYLWKAFIKQIYSSKNFLTFLGGGSQPTQQNSTENGEKFDQFQKFHYYHCDHWPGHSRMGFSSKGDLRLSRLNWSCEKDVPNFIQNWSW